MVVSKTPERPWAKVGADLFEHKGTTYLLTIDYYSKWIEVDKLDNLTSKNTISYLKSQFARHGIPDELRSDNGPQFGSAEFAEFAIYYGFVHTTSTPHYPQANGEAERGVQTIKTLLKKAADPYQALLNYRNTPLDGLSLSPAQLLMGCRLKTMLPTTAALLRPQGSAEVKNALEKKKKKEKQYYDKHCGKELPSLHTGDVIRMQKGRKWEPATVLYKHQSPRSYVVETPEGSRYRRNRRQLHSTQVPLQSAVETFATLSTDPTNQLQNSAGSKGTDNNETPSSKSNTRDIYSEPPASREEPCMTPIKQSPEPTPRMTRSGRIVKPPTYLSDFQ